MFVRNMLEQHLNLLAVHMDQLAALLTLAVIALLYAVLMLVAADVLVARRCGPIENVLINNTFLHHAVHLTINRCGADRLALLLEMLADVRNCDMLA